MKLRERFTDVQVIVALIALIGTLGTALIANWDKVFQTMTASSGAAPAAAVPASAPMNSPEAEATKKELMRLVDEINSNK